MSFFLWAFDIFYERCSTNFTVDLYYCIWILYTNVHNSDNIVHLSPNNIHTVNPRLIVLLNRMSFNFPFFLFKEMQLDTFPQSICHQRRHILRYSLASFLHTKKINTNSRIPHLPPPAPLSRDSTASSSSSLSPSRWDGPSHRRHPQLFVSLCIYQAHSIIASLLSVFNLNILNAILHLVSRIFRIRPFVKILRIFVLRFSSPIHPSSPHPPYPRHCRHLPHNLPREVWTLTRDARRI